LHLLSLEVDSVNLTTTTHSEVSVEIRDLGIGETGRDDVEGVVEVENVIVESEITAEREKKRDNVSVRGCLERASVFCSADASSQFHSDRPSSYVSPPQRKGRKRDREREVNEKTHEGITSTPASLMSCHRAIRCSLATF